MKKGHFGWLPSYPDDVEFVVLPYPTNKEMYLPVLWFLDFQDLNDARPLPTVAAIDVRGVNVNFLEDVVDNVVTTAFMWVTNRQWDNLVSANDDTVARIQAKTNLFIVDYDGYKRGSPFTPTSWPVWTLWQVNAEGLIYFRESTAWRQFESVLDNCIVPVVEEPTIGVEGKYEVTIRKVE